MFELDEEQSEQNVLRSSNMYANGKFVSAENLRSVSTPEKFKQIKPHMHLIDSAQLPNEWQMHFRQRGKNLLI